RLRQRRLRDSSGRGASRSDGPQRRGGARRRAARDRMARRRPCDDDRAGSAGLSRHTRAVAAAMTDADAADTEILTFGCRLNSYEPEVMRGHARAAGLVDTIIVNPCAVTAESERQARQAIRRARRERPNARIVVTGCAAQIDPARYAAMPEVDRVIG